MASSEAAAPQQTTYPSEGIQILSEAVKSDKDVDISLPEISKSTWEDRLERSILTRERNAFMMTLAWGINAQASMMVEKDKFERPEKKQNPIIIKLLDELEAELNRCKQTVVNVKYTYPEGGCFCLIPVRGGEVVDENSRSKVVCDKGNLRTAWEIVEENQAKADYCEIVALFLKALKIGYYFNIINPKHTLSFRAGKPTVADHGGM